MDMLQIGALSLVGRLVEALPLTEALHPKLNLYKNLNRHPLCLVLGWDLAEVLELPCSYVALYTTREVNMFYLYADINLLRHAV